jgi:hypothetical protein
MRWWPDYEVELRRLAREERVDPDSEQWLRELAWTLAVKHVKGFGDRLGIGPAGAARGTILTGERVVCAPLKRGQRRAPRKRVWPPTEELKTFLSRIPIAQLSSVNAAAKAIAAKKDFQCSEDQAARWLKAVGGRSFLEEVRAARSRRVRR